MYMEVTYSSLKQKDVINLSDGKHMGKVCDLTFCFPENRVTGFTVTGCKGFKFTRQELFIPIKCVTKIGEDAVLINFGGEQPPPPKCPPKHPPEFAPPPPPQPQPRRSFDEYE